MTESLHPVVKPMRKRGDVKPSGIDKSIYNQLVIIIIIVMLSIQSFVTYGI